MSPFFHLRFCYKNLITSEIESVNEENDCIHLVVLLINNSNSTHFLKLLFPEFTYIIVLRSLFCVLLNRHNEDMEKIMIKRHREQRTSIKVDRENKKSYHKTDKNGLIDKSIDKNEVDNTFITFIVLV